ncbi:hypothetical protein HQ560_08365, partial [bacterium]|nr:hypothetical protein [bacterium]
VPAEDIVPLLQNLADCLTPGGQMIHCVHLEDHKSTRKTPFKFLTLSRAEYPRELEIERGNRVRWSQWEECLSQVTGMDFDILYKWSREDVPLPSPVDPSVRHTGEADIRISHFGLHGTKKPTG